MRLRGNHTMNEYYMRVPVISTGHIKLSTAEYIDNNGMNNPSGTLNVVAKYPEGCFLYVGPIDEWPGFDRLPEDLQDVCRWAAEREHEWIRLDADGSLIDTLKTYPWEGNANV